jgi:hypothetical protein
VKTAINKVRVTANQRQAFRRELSAPIGATVLDACNDIRA